MTTTATARCYVCGRIAPTATWERLRYGTSQTMRVFQSHPTTVLGGVECVATGHAVLPEQKTPGRR